MFLTVFTPTYNRGYTILSLYNSLKRQTNKNFEWVVVDDGSTDNTKEIFEKILLDVNDFNINYKRVSNGGKHRAINLGVKIAKGDLFFIVDSDDFLTDDAVSSIFSWTKSLPKKGMWAGVSGLRGDTKNKIIGSTFKGDFIDATSIERLKLNILGDKAEVFFTSVLKQFPFKEFVNENFITEDTVWLLIAKAGYKIRWHNKIIYICEYLQDGLTNNWYNLRIQNQQGALYASLIYLDVFKNNFRKKYSTIYNYYVVAKANGKKNKDIATDLHVLSLSVLYSRFLHKVYSLSKKKKVQ